LLHARCRVIACNYFLHRTAASIFFLHQEQPAELPALSITSSLFPNQPVSSSAQFSCRPTTKCSHMHLWVGVDRNSLPPLPRCCHQRAVGHACAANEKPHLS
jgi:hypothetical protein